MIFIKGILFRKKYEYDSEFILCPIYNFNRNVYLNLRLLTRTLLSIPLAFFLGYSIYFLNLSSIDQIKAMVIKFTLGFIISFYLLQIPHELIHYIIYSDFFTNKDIRIKLFNRKRFFTTICNGTMSKLKVFFGLFTPIFIVTLILSAIMLVRGFNILIYSIVWANLILCSEDLLNIFLSISSEKADGLYEIPNDYNYMLENNKEQTE